MSLKIFAGTFCLVIIGLVALGCSNPQHEFVECVLGNYNTETDRIWWSSVAEGRFPKHDEYIEALHNITKYCPDPPKRTYAAMSDIESCYTESEQYVRDKYTTEKKYVEAFTDEEIAGIDEWMPAIVGRMCLGTVK